MSKEHPIDLFERFDGEEPFDVYCLCRLDHARDREQRFRERREAASLALDLEQIKVRLAQGKAINEPLATLTGDDRTQRHRCIAFAHFVVHGVWPAGIDQRKSDPKPVDIARPCMYPGCYERAIQDTNRCKKHEYET